MSTERERYAGYLDAMAAAGAAVRPDLVFHGARDSDDAIEVSRQLLALDEPPTAIFSAQNLITMGVCRALRQVDAHHRIALVGFDDFVLADLLEPGITVVAQDPREIGRLAAELLFQRMAHPHEPVVARVVESKLIVRGSGEIPPR